MTTSNSPESKRSGDPTSLSSNPLSSVIGGHVGFTRRRMLEHAACGFGSLALAGVVKQAAAESADDNPLASKAPHFAPRAKRIIFLFMQGGPSHVDTFDPKPRLTRDDGKKFPFRNARVRRVQDERILKSPWKFRQYGQSGRWVSELLPHQAECVDDLCLLRSVHTEGVAHGPSTLMLHCGATTLIRPSLGSWLLYGLGTENQNMPGFMTITPSSKMGGPRNYGNAFLPTIYQGTPVGRAASGSPVRIPYITNGVLPPAVQKDRLDLLRQLNGDQLLAAGDDDELEAAVRSFELAYRMQTRAPELFDLSDETRETLDLYGIGQKPTEEFGRACLMARRLCESGVRFVQVNYADSSNNPRWDQHSNLRQHEKHALATDQPVAALLKDLKRRGLLEDTLVWWGGEFGRTPFAQGRDGRDHNPDGFSVWLAGGGVKPGIAYGMTDEFGHKAVENKIHMHDLHATLLFALGLEHTQLTYRYAGRDFRLTDVHGRIIHDLFA